MGIRTSCIVTAIFGALIITAAYICRGYWAAGSEWVLIPAVGAAALYFPEKEEDDV